MKRTSTSAVLALSVLAALLGTQAWLTNEAFAGDPVKGAGSTFAAKIVNDWAGTVGNVSYEAVGSGSGRQMLVTGDVDFAVSDSPASAQERSALESRGGAVHAPATAGGLAIVYNAGGFNATLSGPTLAKIFSGTITNWNDPAVTADSGASGPNLPIVVVYRSDKSGSSGTLTGYLSAAGGGNWGGGTTEQFPGRPGQMGVEGGSGMASKVGATNGAIGYVDHGAARGAGLAEAKVKNGSGEARGPDAAAVSAALDAVKTSPDGTVAVDYTAGGAAYPITSVSYVITTGKLSGPKYDTVKAFLDYALGEGQDRADALGYAPLPARLRTFAKDQEAKISSS